LAALLLRNSKSFVVFLSSPVQGATSPALFLPNTELCDFRYDEAQHERLPLGDPSKRAFTYFVLTGGRFIYASALRLLALKFILSMTVRISSGLQPGLTARLFRPPPPALPISQAYAGFDAAAFCTALTLLADESGFKAEIGFGCFKGRGGGHIFMCCRLPNCLLASRQTRAGQRVERRLGSCLSMPIGTRNALVH
jgi:Ubiquinol cytochrome reductase transmembrane region